ncbi:hypothetical protein EV646_11779 [Kribbella antiqua]|uniref:Uncharacterized protein n=1 Tax=Kribbella antiqua TaxID=2512217 RepID=A0A4R2IAV7_9ACTN|nr:hypothetical protein EV646_11779 [Kribbella antiqua]
MHWANASSATLDLNGGTVYGAPLWDENRVTADNPMQNLERYRDKRIFLVAGTSPDPVNWFDTVKPEPGTGPAGVTGPAGLPACGGAGLRRSAGRRQRRRM